MKKKPSDITKQSEGAGGIKWAKELYEKEIAHVAAKEPLTIIKLIRKIWGNAFTEGQRYREGQIIEYLEQRIASHGELEVSSQETKKILQFMKGFSLYHED